jgi:hypothetical protein
LGRGHGDDSSSSAGTDPADAGTRCRIGKCEVTGLSDRTPHPANAPIGGRGADAL